MKLLFFRKLILGLLCGFMLSTALLLIFALILSKQADPSQNLILFSRIPLVAGAIVTGKLSSLRLENKLLQGVASGLLYTLVMLVPSALFSSFDASSLLWMLITFVSAFAGAMIGKKSYSSNVSKNRRKAVMKRYAR